MRAQGLDATRAARLLRAKAAELEAAVIANAPPLGELETLRADVALLAGLLADALEREVAR